MYKLRIHNRLVVIIVLVSGWTKRLTTRLDRHAPTHQRRGLVSKDGIVTLGFELLVEPDLGVHRLLLQNGDVHLLRRLLLGENHVNGIVFDGEDKSGGYISRGRHLR